MDGLIDHFKPMGTIEEILVEKLAVSYWRQRRAKRYEIGIIRNTLDTFTDELNTDELRQDIECNKNKIKGLKPLLTKIYRDWAKEQRPPLSDYYGNEWALGWHELALFYDNQNEKLNKNWIGMSNQEIHDLIINSGFKTDFNYFHDLFTEYIETRIKEIETLKLALRDKELEIERMPLINGVLDEDELNKLLRYETAIEKQFYKALTELERIQRTKGGEVMPLPISLEITNN